MPLPPLPDPESRSERVGGLARVLPVLSFMGMTLLGFNAAQTASTVLLPVSRKKFRAFNRWAADLWWGWCVRAAEMVHGIRVEMTGDPVPAGESAIVVANHQQMPDITFLMFFARDKGRLGDMKWILKDVIKYVPGVGWGLYFLDSFFVKREWTRDQSMIEQTFARIIRDDIPVWLMSFAEGTRITEEKLQKSRAYAEEHGHPPPNNVLLPRTKGFVASVKGLRDHVAAVYDVTIGYQAGVPTLWQYVKGYVKSAHLHVRRYPIEELPTDDAGLSDWLFARYREKDELLEHFYAHGSFPDGSR